jgi:hypothetical protein
VKTNSSLFVVLGLDSEKKPHAARFNTADEAAVRKAAGVKGFKIGIAKTKEAAEAAQKLIEGRIFDSGKGLVPFCSQEVYDRLLKLLEVEDKPANPVAAPDKALPAPATADPWAAIKMGSVVLCPDEEKGADQAFWPCVVTAVSKDNKTFTVRWKGAPTLKPFTIKRTAVAILPSKP